MALQKLVIHSTKTPYGIYVPLDEIQEEHITDRGFSEIGFSDIITFEGVIESTLQIRNGEKTHDWGMTDSRHVAYMGGISEDGFNIEDTRTPEQRESLRIYIEFLKRRYPRIEIVDYTKTRII
tara:strand:+ start:1246 stop:1614 length:369 start_codon:yes stop_codon:yes gene_type:complete